MSECSYFYFTIAILSVKYKITVIRQNFFVKRIELLKEVTEHLNNVEIVGFNGLLAQYCEEHGVDAIVKGLRAVTDFEYEFQMALTNKKLNPNLETLFLTAEADSMYLSSSMVREIASMGGDISNFVPACIHDRIVERLKNK